MEEGVGRTSTGHAARSHACRCCGVVLSAAAAAGQWTLAPPDASKHTDDAASRASAAARVGVDGQKDGGTRSNDSLLASFYIASSLCAPCGAQLGLRDASAALVAGSEAGGVEDTAGTRTDDARHLREAVERISAQKRLVSLQAGFSPRARAPQADPAPRGVPCDRRWRSARSSRSSSRPRRRSRGARRGGRRNSAAW